MPYYNPSISFSSFLREGGRTCLRSLSFFLRVPRYLCAGVQLFAHLCKRAENRLKIEIQAFCDTFANCRRGFS